jgi:hypothetical protein
VTECKCDADDKCPVSSTTNGCDADSYAIARVDGGVVCVTFGSGSKVTVGDATTLAPIPINPLEFTIGNAPTSTFSHGAAATSENGNKLHALLLYDRDSGRGVFYSECGPFIVESDLSDGGRKRTPEEAFLTGGTGGFVDSVTASGDPHLAGAHGITFDVYGKPAANYSLLVAPAFEVNMQLAEPRARDALHDIDGGALQR